MRAGLRLHDPHAGAGRHRPLPRELMERYFGSFATRVRRHLRRAHGPRPARRRARRDPLQHGGDGAAPGRRGRNGVAQLHGAVSREMFAGLWPDVPTEEVPIGSVTNGVHAQTWISPEIDDLLTRHVAARVGRRRRPRTGRGSRRSATTSCGGPCSRAGSAWSTFVRSHLRESRLAQGLSASDVAWTNGVLDPTVLTIGFARRFATYKRATLLLSQPERLRGPALRRRPAGPDRVRRQGPPGRRRRARR